MAEVQSILAKHQMRPSSTKPLQNIILAVGKIVLCCQQIERHFKFLLPFVDADDPNLKSILKRHQALSRKPLGELAGQFASASSGDVESLKIFLKQVVDRRNILVHHFYEQYGNAISDDQTEEVLEALKSQHKEARTLLRGLQEMSLALLEAMRDSNVLGSENFRELDELCQRSRETLAT